MWKKVLLVVVEKFVKVRVLGVDSFVLVGVV